MDSAPPTPAFTPLVVRTGQATLTGSVAQILPADPTRLVLLVTAPLASITGSMCLGATDGTGFEFGAIPGVISRFDWRTDGDIVHLSLSTTAAMGSGTISWATLSRM